MGEGGFGVGFKLARAVFMGFEVLRISRGGRAWRYFGREIRVGLLLARLSKYVSHTFSSSSSVMFGIMLFMKFAFTGSERTDVKESPKTLSRRLIILFICRSSSSSLISSFLGLSLFATPFKVINLLVDRLSGSNKLSPSSQRLGLSLSISSFKI